jgi:hypothetical protein
MNNSYFYIVKQKQQPMKSIRFSESELEFLKNHYELELVEAENYITEIRNILSKLGVLAREVKADKPAKAGKKRGRPKKKEVAPVAEAAPEPKKAKKKVRRRKAKKAAPKKVVVKKAPVKKAAPKKAAPPKIAEKKAPEVKPEVAKEPPK